VKFEWFNRLVPPALALIAIVCANADELRLANGDVLKGQLVAIENGRIEFLSPVLGTIHVDSSQATASTSTEVTAAATPVPAAAPSGADAKAGKPKQASSDVRDSPWRSRIDLGFNWQNGRKSRQDVNVRYESERNLGPNNYRLQARYVLSESNGITSADRRDAGLRWRHEVNERWFSQAQTTYLDDAVKNIDLNLDQNVGMGYRWMNRDHAKANVGTGMTLQYRDAEGIESGFNEFAVLFQDLLWRFNDRFEFAQEAGALYSPKGRPLNPTSSGNVEFDYSDVPNYKFTFQSVLRGQLTKSMSVNLRYEYEFDNAVLNRDARSDQRISTSLGYVF
jgi:putative salt-induced outer membrane protein YdiY